MPFISEIIKTVPAGKKLVVEIKTGPEIVPFMKKDILKSGKADQMIFIAFGWESILAAKKAFPSNECYWLSSTKKSLLEKMEESAREGLEGVNLNYKIIDQEVMKKAEELGIEVLAWTVNDPDMAKTLINLGVEKITTDRPRWLKEEIIFKVNKKRSNLLLFYFKFVLMVMIVFCRIRFGFVLVNGSERMFRLGVN